MNFIVLFLFFKSLRTNVHIIFPLLKSPPEKTVFFSVITALDLNFPVTLPTRFKFACNFPFKVGNSLKCLEKKERLFIFNKVVSLTFFIISGNIFFLFNSKIPLDKTLKDLFPNPIFL